VATQAEKRVEYALLENGLDFVLSALEHVGSKPDRRQLKYAVLHLYAGVALVLKERLRQEDWRLLFEKQEKADE
jgi:hypothetical protein